MTASVVCVDHCGVHHFTSPRLALRSHGMHVWWALRPEWAATKSADWANMVGDKDENNADAADIAATDSEGDDGEDDFDDDMEDVL